MKRILILALLMGLLIMPAFAGEKSMNTDEQICRRNIKLLANALELYANDHYTDYPIREEFESRKFDKYIFLALGRKVKNTDQFYRCPPKGWLEYKRSKTDKSFTLTCPHPEKYGLKALYFSSRNGFVRDDGKKESGVIYMETRKKAGEPVSDRDKAEMQAVIKDLYEAYKNRDLEKVMQIENESIMRSAKEMVQRRPDIRNEMEVYYALKGTKNDVFRAEGFGMEPFNDKDIHFKREGSALRAYSYTPIISTKQVKVNMGNGMVKVRLRIASFHFEKINGKLVITKMQLY